MHLAVCCYFAVFIFFQFISFISYHLKVCKVAIILCSSSQQVVTSISPPYDLLWTVECSRNDTGYCLNSRLKMSYITLSIFKICHCHVAVQAYHDDNDRWASSHLLPPAHSWSTARHKRPSLTSQPRRSMSSPARISFVWPRSAN